MKKINKKLIIYFFILYLLFLGYYLSKIFFTKESIYLNSNAFSIRFNKFKLTKDCNFSYLGKNNIFIYININKAKKIIHNKNNKIKSAIYVKKNIIFYKNKKFFYLGDFLKNKKQYSLFLLNTPKTKFYFVNLFHKLDDTNLTLILNSNDKLIFKYLDKNLTLKKFYVNIKNFQKDINESINK